MTLLESLEAWWIEDTGKWEPDFCTGGKEPQAHSIHVQIDGMFLQDLQHQMCQQHIYAAVQH